MTTDPVISSSSDPDQRVSRQIRTAWCSKHGVEGFESKYTAGQFYHPMPNGDRHTFLPEAAIEVARDPYAHLYRGGPGDSLSAPAGRREGQRLEARPARRKPMSGHESGTAQ